MTAAHANPERVPVHKLIHDSLLTDSLRLPLGPVVGAASRLAGERLRSMDALHLATAQQLAQPLTELITYDERLASHAAAAGLTVTAPD
ncbi:MAG: hypothetical protein ACRDTU_06830 [Micromonosporaceae bacterium]